MKTTVNKLGKPAIAAVLFVITSSFAMHNHHPHSKKEPAKRVLMVGIAYRPVKCGAVSFSEAVDYTYITGCGSGDYAGPRQAIESALFKQHNTDKKDIVLKSSQQAFGVVLSYSKKMVGWNCSVKRYAVGFGDTLSEAAEAAEKNKKSDDAKAAYTQVASFSCAD